MKLKQLHIIMHLVLTIYFTSCEYIHKCPNNSICMQYTFPFIGHDCLGKNGYNGTSCQLYMYNFHSVLKYF